MTFFLEGIYNTENGGMIPPSAIRVDFPVPIPGKVRFDHYEQIQGLLTNEVTISSQIKWGSILNDVSSIQDVASLLGSEKMWTWIGASTMCWKGTEPLRTSFDFYLINYRRKLGLEERLKNLNLLAALIESKGFAEPVTIHGGYASNVLETNKKLLRNGNKKSATESKALSGWEEIARGDLDEGTLRIRIGNKLRLSNMLLHRLDVTPSVVEVPDGRPLYYRVSMSVVGAQPLLGRQVEDMYSAY